MTRYFFPFLIVTMFAVMGANAATDWVGGYIQAAADHTAQKIAEAN